MDKIIKKGIEILTMKNGKKKYKPYVVKSGSGFNKLYIGSYSFGGYYLTKDGYITRESEEEAVYLLNQVVDKFNMQEQEKEDRKIVKVEDKEL